MRSVPARQPPWSMAGMEMKRLGLVSKPAYVVPNHMLEQFSAEFLQAYPMANILVATREATAADARKEFVARCATGDWDAVVITHDAFVRIPVSEEAETDYLESQVSAYRAAQVQSNERARPEREEAGSRHHPDGGTDQGDPRGRTAARRGDLRGDRGRLHLLGRGPSGEEPRLPHPHTGRGRLQDRSVPWTSR